MRVKDVVSYKYVLFQLNGETMIKITRTHYRLRINNKYINKYYIKREILSQNFHTTTVLAVGSQNAQNESFRIFLCCKNFRYESDGFVIHKVV